MIIKSCRKIFDVGMVKNECGQPVDETLKLIVSQKWTDEITDFLHAGTNSGQPKGDSMIFGWEWSKMVMAF